VPRKPKEVFLSYSYDDEKHVQTVLELSNRLRDEGVECVLDQYEQSPPEGWPRWMDRKIREAHFVLVICTEEYNRRLLGGEPKDGGLGVKWEGGIIYQHLYNAGGNNTKFTRLNEVSKRFMMRWGIGPAFRESFDIKNSRQSGISHCASWNRQQQNSRRSSNTCTTSQSPLSENPVRLKVCPGAERAYLDSQLECLERNPLTDMRAGLAQCLENRSKILLLNCQLDEEAFEIG